MQNGILIGKGTVLPREEALKGILAIGSVPDTHRNLFVPNMQAAVEAGDTSFLVLGDEGGGPHLPGTIEVDLGATPGFRFGEMRRRPMRVVLRPNSNLQNAGAFATAIQRLLRGQGDVPVNLFVDQHRAGAIDRLVADATLFCGWNMSLIMAAGSFTALEKLYGPEGRILIQNFRTVLLHGDLPGSVVDQARGRIAAKEQDLPAVGQEDVLFISTFRQEIELLGSSSNGSWFGSLKAKLFGE